MYATDIDTPLPIVLCSDGRRRRRRRRTSPFTSNRCGASLCAGGRSNINHVIFSFLLYFYRIIKIIIVVKANTVLFSFSWLLMVRALRSVGCVEDRGAMYTILLYEHTYEPVATFAVDDWKVPKVDRVFHFFFSPHFIMNEQLHKIELNTWNTWKYMRLVVRIRIEEMREEMKTITDSDTLLNSLRTQYMVIWESIRLVSVFFECVSKLWGNCWRREHAGQIFNWIPLTIHARWICTTEKFNYPNNIFEIGVEWVRAHRNRHTWRQNNVQV